MARAISSFPVPVSPKIRTVESVGATFATCASTRRSGVGGADDFFEHGGPYDVFAQRQFSFRTRSSARLRSSMSVPVAYQRTRCPCSSRNGL